MSGTFRVVLQTIKPGQFALSTMKLQRALKSYERTGLESFSVRRVGANLVLTDGHHRAIVAQLMGVEEVDVYLDSDNYDWDIWIRCVEVTCEHGVATLNDLIGRLVTHDEYERTWCHCCDEVTQRVEAERAESAEVDSK
jgi:hypothetical protein